MDDDEVGHFELARPLFLLQIVSRLRLEEEDDAIGESAHGGIGLAGADGFQEDEVG